MKARIAVVLGSSKSYFTTAWCNASEFNFTLFPRNGLVTTRRAADGIEGETSFVPELTPRSVLLGFPAVRVSSSEQPSHSTQAVAQQKKSRVAKCHVSEVKRETDDQTGHNYENVSLIADSRSRRRSGRIIPRNLCDRLYMG